MDSIFSTLAGAEPVVEPEAPTVETTPQAADAEEEVPTKAAEEAEVAEEKMDSIFSSLAGAEPVVEPEAPSVETTPQAADAEEEAEAAGEELGAPTEDAPMEVTAAPETAVEPAETSLAGEFAAAGEVEAAD